MRAMPYLQLVNGKYRIRIVVPPELRPYLLPPHTGKANLTRAPKPRLRNGHCAASTMAARDPPPRAFEMASFGNSDFSGPMGAWRRFCRTGPELLQSVEKGFCGFQIGRLETFREPVVHRLNERKRLRRTALIA